MKKYVARAVVVLALSLATLAGVASAQPGQIAGGYSDASVSDRAVRRAAKTAVRDHSRREHHAVKLVKIVKAEQQVVSGMNYRLCLKVKRPGHRSHTVTAVVYEPIRKSMRLTDWSEGGCSDD